MAETKKQMQERLERYEQLLEQERKAYADLLDKYGKLQNSGDDLFKQTPEYKQMSSDLLAYKDSSKTLERRLATEKKLKTKLQDRLAEAERKYQELISDTKELREKTKHNARGAGRKPSKERLQAIEEMRQLLDAGKDEQEIMNEMNIGRATFYRYKRSIKN